MGSVCLGPPVLLAYFVIDNIPSNIPMTFTHNYLMQEFPLKKNLNANIINDICTTHYVTCVTTFLK